jgi:BirA family biotin operon repressor/biotin-[acetyl-CoA-carboxylase] ligase
LRVKVKWPNDILADGLKCAGLLVEASEPWASNQGAGVSDGEIPLILGIGLNLFHERGDFPLELQDSATSLSLALGEGGGSGLAMSSAGILESLAASVDLWFGRWEREGFGPVREAWLEDNATLGRRVLIVDEGVEAIAEDLDSSGALIVRADDGRSMAVGCGEIRFVGLSGALA